MTKVTITHAYQNHYEYDIICKNPELKILEFAAAYEAEAFYGKVENPGGKVSLCVWDMEGVPQCGYKVGNYSDYSLVVVPTVLYVAIYYDTLCECHIAGYTLYSLEDTTDEAVLEKVKTDRPSAYQHFLGFVKIDVPRG